MHHSFANTKRYAEITEAMIKTAMGFFLWPRSPCQTLRQPLATARPPTKTEGACTRKKVRAGCALPTASRALAVIFANSAGVQIWCVIASRTVLAASTKPAVGSPSSSFSLLGARSSSTNLPSRPTAHLGLNGRASPPRTPMKDFKSLPLER